ncbi:acetylornithine transaminase [soil metagenome]
MMPTDPYQTQAAHYIFNTYGRYPITLVKGKGVKVQDSKGKEYLDFLTGIGCTPLGHCHPAVSRAIIEQTETILHTSNLYYSPPSIKLAKWLVDNGGLDKVFFCNSGTEAIEMAIKLARKYHWVANKPQKNTIITASHSFHGRTLGALAATAKAKIHEGFAPLPAGFDYQPWNDIEAFCKAINANTAAVILEPIQGEGGIHVANKEFLLAVRQACDKVGALLIFDEIQCGIGRTGELFAYQYFGVQPDVITLAKAIANGLPLGAVCATTDVAKALVPGDHGSTFGGNPVTCSAALATLTTIKDQDYLTQVKKMGNYLLTGLQNLQQQYPQHIKEVRGAGLMLGVELLTDPQQVLQFCQDNGLLVNITADNVLRMLPPYIITETNVDFALNVLRQALGPSMLDNA